jgi:hypothetical protein
MPATAPDSTNIAALEDERYAAMLAGDVDALDRLMHPQMMYAHSSGFEDTKSDYLDKLRRGVYVYRAIRRAGQRVTVNRNVAMVFQELNIEVMVNGVLKTMSNRALAVWTYEDDRWQLLGVQSGSMPGATPAKFQEDKP